jgi:hypothetical protein
MIIGIVFRKYIFGYYLQKLVILLIWIIII